MEWTPRVPLVAAEAVVDYQKINGHIVERRATLERAIRRPVLDLADSIFLHSGFPSTRATDTLRSRLFVGLGRTYLFGYREARRELAAHRKGQNVPVEEWESPPTNVAPYLDGFVSGHLRNFVVDLSRFYVETLDPNDMLMQTHLREKAERLAHNMVLEQIGYVLNAGRTLAALGRDEPILAARTQARWAMRSEQLDENTCAPCDTFHGELAAVGTPEYFALLPPSGCLGRGRCRGIMVYADSSDDFKVRRLL